MKQENPLKDLAALGKLLSLSGDKETLSSFPSRPIVTKTASRVGGLKRRLLYGNKSSVKRVSVTPYEVLGYKFDQALLTHFGITVYSFSGNIQGFKSKLPPEEGFSELAVLNEAEVTPFKPNLRLLPKGFLELSSAPFDKFAITDGVLRIDAGCYPIFTPVEFFVSSTSWGRLFKSLNVGGTDYYQAVIGNSLWVLGGGLLITGPIERND